MPGHACSGTIFILTLISGFKANHTCSLSLATRYLVASGKKNQCVQTRYSDVTKVPIDRVFTKFCYFFEGLYLGNAKGYINYNGAIFELIDPT